MSYPSYPECPPDCWCSRKASQLEGEKRALEIFVEGLDEKLAQMRSAASSAAATTVTAIERIQEMEKVVTAAEAWAEGGSHAVLVDAVKAWRKLKKAWA